MEELPDATAAQQLSACEEESILVSLENLLTFPWLKARVDSGDLTLHGWYFDIGTGELVGYNAKSDVFENLA